MGMTGKSCLMAQLSGMDWNREKLQKYVSDMSRSRPGQFLGRVLQFLHQPADLAADRPEQAFGHAALFQRHVAAAEQAHRHIQRLLGVVEAFEHVARVEILVGFQQGVQRLLVLFVERARNIVLVSLLGHAQHAEDQHAVIGGDGSAAFREDRGMRHFGFIAHGLQVIHDVVGIFLQRVIHARFEVRLGTVVVDAQTAADVEVFQAGAPPRQIGVDASCLDQRRFDVPNVGDLAAQMEMQQLEAIGHSMVAQFIQAAQHLADGQAELGAETAGGLPAAGATRRQFDPHADLRPHADLLGIVQHHLQLGVLLDDRNDLAADLLGQHRHFDELGVLEPVADDRRIGLRHRDHRQQLRLAAGLEAEPVTAAVLDHLLHDVPLLVDLDRVHAAVPAAVIVVLDRRGEGVMDLLQAVLENPVEAQQDRQVQTPHLQAVNQLLHVHGLVCPTFGMHPQMAAGPDREIALSPPGHIVQLGRVDDAPTVNRFFQHGHLMRVEHGVTDWQEHSARVAEQHHKQAMIAEPGGLQHASFAQADPQPEHMGSLTLNTSVRETAVPFRGTVAMPCLYDGPFLR